MNDEAKNNSTDFMNDHALLVFIVLFGQKVNTNYSYETIVMYFITRDEVSNFLISVPNKKNKKILSCIKAKKQ